MEEQFKELDPLLHARLRLAIVSLLISVEEADFNFLKDKTNATAGNLSVQLGKLEEAKYIRIHKSFKGKRPLTKCQLTPKGITAFQKYVANIQGYLTPDKTT